MEDDESKDVELLVEKLFELGGRTNNAELREASNWPSDKYLTVRKKGIALGLIGIGPGRGGIVFLTDSAKATLAPSELPASAEADKKAVEESAREAVYYKKLLPALKGEWVRSEDFDDSLVEVTASKRVRGAGRWTVPDIVVVGKIIWQYVPGFTFTVHSIEVKRFEALDALAVFEALNHKRASHFSYLIVVNAPTRFTESALERLTQVAQLCEEHEVGLVVIPTGKESNFDAWDFRVETAHRHEPDPYNLDGFIKQYLSSEARDQIAKMVR